MLADIVARVETMSTFVCRRRLMHNDASIDEVTNDVTCLHSGRPLLFYAGGKQYTVSMTEHIQSFLNPTCKSLVVLML